MRELPKRHFFHLGQGFVWVETILIDEGKEAALQWAFERDKDVTGSSYVNEHVQNIYKFLDDLLDQFYLPYSIK